MKVVYLYPNNNLDHISYRLNMHSDNLFGLICWAIRFIYSEEKLISLLNNFENGEAPFNISSSYPFTYEKIEDKPVNIKRFYPKPMLESKIDRQDTDFKKFKKINYIPEELLNDLVQGKSNIVDIFNNKDKWKIYYEELKENKTEVVHNTINRLTNSTMQEGGLYLLNEIVLHKKGLFFIVKDTVDNIVENSLEFLSHYGFGTDRTTGKNHFKVYVENNINFIKYVENPNCFMILSCYVPNEDEINYYQSKAGSPLLNYDLLVREGMIPINLIQTNKLRKKGIVVFKEGSTFPIENNNKINYGKTYPIDEINDKHKIYFYGNPIIIKMKIGE